MLEITGAQLDDVIPVIFNIRDTYGYMTDPNTIQLDVYEQVVTTPVVSNSTMSRLGSLTGVFSGSFVASAENGFENGKYYTVVVEVTMDGTNWVRTPVLLLRVGAEGLSAIEANDVVPIIVATRDAYGYMADPNIARFDVHEQVTSTPLIANEVMSKFASLDGLVAATFTPTTTLGFENDLYYTILTEITMDGTNWVREPHLLFKFGPTSTATNTWVTVAEADAFMSNRLNTTVWNSATDAQKLIALTQATNDYFELLRWKDGVEDVIPENVQIAVTLVAQALLDGFDPDADRESLSVKSEGMSHIRESYDRPYVDAWRDSGLPSFTAYKLILPYLAPHRVSLKRVS